MKGEEVAGGIYLSGAILTFVFGGGIMWVPLVLGIALLIPKERAKSDALRLVLFLWIFGSLVFAVVGGFTTSYWYPILPAILTGGGIAALMFEGMEGKKTVLPASMSILGIVLGMFA